MLSCLLLTALWSAAKMADHLALLYVNFLCGFFFFFFFFFFFCFIVFFPYDVQGQVWYLIVSIPDLCLPLFFF